MILENTLTVGEFLVTIESEIQTRASPAERYKLTCFRGEAMIGYQFVEVSLALGSERKKNFMESSAHVLVKRLTRPDSARILQERR